MFFILYMYSFQIIVWNSLHNKYGEHIKAFTPSRTKMFFTNCKSCFAFCGVILGISNILFDNSIQWISKTEKYNLDKLNFPWEKTASQFLYDLQLYNRNN